MNMGVHPVTGGQHPGGMVGHDIFTIKTVFTRLILAKEFHLIQAHVGAPPVMEIFNPLLSLYKVAPPCI
jgi:hypothetical protein